MTRRRQSSLFDEPVEIEAVPDHQAAFFAGILATWVFGERKPKPAEREELYDIAREALARARTLGRD